MAYATTDETKRGRAGASRKGPRKGQPERPKGDRHSMTGDRQTNKERARARREKRRAAEALLAAFIGMDAKPFVTRFRWAVRLVFGRLTPPNLRKSRQQARRAARRAAH